MASTAKVVVSSLPGLRAARRSGWAWLQVLRDGLGGALLLVAWLALWTVTWAAVAGPLSPGREAPVSSVEARS